MKRITCAALALALTSCTSEGAFDTPPGATVKGAVMLRADGRAELDVEIGVNLAASGRERHFGLDGVRIEDVAGNTWTIDAVEFDAKDWPIVAEDEAAERRVLHVRAHAKPLHPNELGAQIIVQLTGDEGPIDVFANGAVSQVFDPCDDPTLGGVPAQAGAPIAWMVPTLTGLVTELDELTGDDAGGVWMASASTSSFSASIMRLYRAVPTGVGAIQEVEGNYARIAPGADGSAVVTLGASEFGVWELRRYDDAIDSLWHHDVSAEEPPLVAVSGGRVAVVLRTFGDVFVDGIPVAPASVSGAIVLLFDEETGEFLTSYEPEAQPARITRAGGGGFAVASASRLQVVEPDLSERWSVDLAEFPADLESTADGDVWVGANTSIVRFGPDGTTKHTYAFANGRDIAPRTDGTVIVSGPNRVTRIDEAGNVNGVAFPVPGAPWCDEGVTFRVAPTLEGTAFGFLRPTVEAPFPGYLGKLTP